ncbi:hypothetical protein [uncultured Sphingomonas sp.]|uniref:hypothetical protein n=1 Tax=uncultured Sphingomonas sp. TaxID=158754 RepID=UPI003748A810
MTAFFGIVAQAAESFADQRAQRVSLEALASLIAEASNVTFEQAWIYLCSLPTPCGQYLRSPSGWECLHNASPFEGRAISIKLH